MDTGDQTVVTAIVLTSLAAVLIVGRCISRFLIIHQPGVEDYLILAAFLMSVGYTTVIGLGSCPFLEVVGRTT